MRNRRRGRRCWHLYLLAKLGPRCVVYVMCVGIVVVDERRTSMNSGDQYVLNEEDGEQVVDEQNDTGPPAATNTQIPTQAWNHRNTATVTHMRSLSTLSYRREVSTNCQSLPCTHVVANIYKLQLLTPARIHGAVCC